MVFSDVAYEALPPGTPASELQAFARYYQDETIRRGSDGTPLPRNPWDEWFSAGTSISSGLQLAAQLLRVSGAGRGGVVLFSDLADDPTDLRPLGRVISLYEQRNIPLRVVALDPTPEDRDFWVELLGPGSLSNVQIPTGDAGRGRLAVESLVPGAIHRARRARRAPPRRERDPRGADHLAPEAGVRLRLALAALCLVVAGLAVVLARDLWRQEKALRDGDARARVGRVDRQTWDASVALSRRSRSVGARRR